MLKLIDTDPLSERKLLGSVLPAKRVKSTCRARVRQLPAAAATVSSDRTEGAAQNAVDATAPALSIDRRVTGGVMRREEREVSCSIPSEIGPEPAELSSADKSSARSPEPLLHEISVITP